MKYRAASASTPAGRMIAKASCWHFDAWMIRGDHRWYIKLEAREGGTKLLNRAWYTVALDGSVKYLKYDEEPMGLNVVLSDKRIREDWREALELAHCNFVMPRARGPLPHMFKSRSVRLHYISLDHMPAPFEGDEGNYWVYGNKT